MIDSTKPLPATVRLDSKMKEHESYSCKTKISQYLEQCLCY